MQRWISAQDRPQRTLAGAVVDLGRSVAKLNGFYIEALQNPTLRPKHRVEILKLAAQLKPLIADIERHCEPIKEV